MTCDVFALWLLQLQRARSVCDPFYWVSLGIKSGLGLESFVGAGQASCYRACAA